MQPSLSIIQSELAISYYDDIGFYLEDTTLESWIKQGVLMLNASLTCTAYQPEGPEALFIEGTHSYYWRVLLMENLFKWMSDNYEKIVFVFLGKKAQYYSKFIDHNKHVVFNEVHPVVDHRVGNNVFVGSKIFNKINENLTEKIKW